MVGNNGEYAQWYKVFENCKCLGSRATPDYEVFKEDTPSYLLSGTRKYFAKDAEETLAPLGMDIVRLPGYEKGWAVPAVLTLGFLTGHEDTAYKYAEKADAVYATIENYVKDIAIADRPYVFVHHNATSIPNHGGGVVETVELAGAKTPLDMGFLPGKVDAEAVSLTLNPEWIILQPRDGIFERVTGGTPESAMDWGVTTLFETDLQYIQAINHSKAYEEGKVLMFTQGIRFGAASYISTAYVANHIYPGVFNFDIESLFDDYLKSYHSDFKTEDWFEYQYYDLDYAEKYYENMKKA